MMEHYHLPSHQSLPLVSQSHKHGTAMSHYHRPGFSKSSKLSRTWVSYGFAPPSPSVAARQSSMHCQAPQPKSSRSSNSFPARWDKCAASEKRLGMTLKAWRKAAAYGPMMTYGRIVMSQLMRSAELNVCSDSRSIVISITPPGLPNRPLKSRVHQIGVRQYTYRARTCGQLEKDNLSDIPISILDQETMLI